MPDTSTGLPKNKEAREHFDIYAILEGPQEMYFGDQVQVNVNLVEKVTLKGPDGETVQKCYLSPTKRRGVERRSLIWAPTKEGVLLGDKQGCGIPATCTKVECPICAVFGGLVPGKSTLVGRLTHGGGVAIQGLYPEKKQRAMHPAEIQKTSSPQPFQREYHSPGLYYPISNHLLSVTETEFKASAYAFLDSLARIGAGNPKGMVIAEHEEAPLLVVDRYLSPLGKRPVLSPHINDPKEAVSSFLRLSQHVMGKEHKGKDEIKLDRFQRLRGDKALQYLQQCADGFVQTHLQG